MRVNPCRRSMDLTRLPLLEVDFNYFRAVGGLEDTVLLGFWD
jgi:hypothetical protein